MNNKPKISIITPTRRRPDLLYRCIKAIQLSTLQEYEHIIVGDNCTYAKQVCDLFLDDKRIKYYETPSPHVWNAGASGKNIGISKSTTEYIVYCDDDNIMLPNHLEVMYNELSSGTPICRSLLYEINLPKGAGSIKKVLEFPITNPSLQGGKPHRNDMQCIGHTKEVIKKEKVIYMVANDRGGYDEIKNPKPLGKRELRKIELEEQAKKEEIELGKKLIRRKTGAVDKRSKNTRSEKQIENAKKLVAFNKKRKEDKLKQEQENLNKVIKDTVTDTVVDVVSKPLHQVKLERKERKNIITDEELKQYEFSKKKSLFS